MLVKCRDLGFHLLTYYFLKHRLLDFTTSMKYEYVDMDSCFLSEKPKPAIQLEDFEIQPELQALPAPMRPLTDSKKVCITTSLYCLF